MIPGDLNCRPAHPEPSKSPLSKPLVALLCAAALAANVLVLARWGGAIFSGPQDYLSQYVGGALAGTPHLYDVDAQLEVQKRAVGFSPASYRVASDTACHFLWLRMPFYALLFKPFTWLPYLTGLVLWKLISLLFLAAAIWVTPAPKVWTTIALVVSLPLWINFMLGNDEALMVLLFAFLARYLASGREAPAGIVLGAIAAIKPQLVPFLFLVLLVRRRWSILLPACISGAALVLLCFPIQGLGWPAQWLHFLATAGFNDNRFQMANLNAMMPRPLPFFSMIAAGATALWFVWTARSVTSNRSLTLAARLRPCPSRRAASVSERFPSRRAASVSERFPSRRAASVSERFDGDTSLVLLAAAAVLGAIALSPHSYVYDYASPLPLLLHAWTKYPRLAKWTAIWALPFIYLPMAFQLFVIGPAILVGCVIAFLFFVDGEAAPSADVGPPPLRNRDVVQTV